jgi:transcriptional regulator with XRE-family HTH domain
MSYAAQARSHFPTQALRVQLEERRKALGWTLREAASKAKCSASYLLDIERNKRDPSAAITVRLARACAMDLDATMDAWCEAKANAAWVAARIAIRAVAR